MKRFIAGLVIGLLIASSAMAFADGQAIKLIVNGEDITAQAAPIIIDGRTLVPARALAEKLGATVEWDGKNNTVVVSSVKDNTQQSKPTEITPNDAYYSFNDIATGAPWYTKDGELVQVYVGGDKLTYENFTDQTKSKIIDIQDYYGPKDNLGRQTPHYLKSDVDKNGLPVYTRDSIEFSDEWIKDKELTATYNLSLNIRIDDRGSIAAADIVAKGSRNPIFHVSVADGTLIFHNGKTYLKKLYVEEQLKKAGLS